MSQWYEKFEIPATGEKTLKLFTCPKSHKFTLSLSEMKKRIKTRSKICPICDGWAYLSKYDTSNYIGRKIASKVCRIDPNVIPMCTEAKFCWKCPDCRTTKNSTLQSFIRHKKCMECRKYERTPSEDCSDDCWEAYDNGDFGGKNTKRCSRCKKILDAKICPVDLCEKQAKWCIIGDKTPLTCEEHNKIYKDQGYEMVYRPTDICTHPECDGFTNPVYGDGKRKKPYRCIKHKEPWMKDKSGSRCKSCGKGAHYVLENKAGRYCQKCAKSESNKSGISFKTDRKLCEKCGIKHPSFNKPGLPPRYCKSCSTSDMVNIKNTKCVECNEITAHYNYRGYPARYCHGCKKDDMVQINVQECQFEGCIERAYFNYKGNKKPIRCKLHKEPGMVSTGNHLCEFEECKRYAVYGDKITKKVQYCREHKTVLGENAINLKHIMCEDCGAKQASYNFKGEPPLYCKGCADFDMIDVRNNTCDECDDRAKYGFPRKRKNKCELHKLDGMVQRPNALCIECKKNIALYGKTANEQELCGDCAEGQDEYFPVVRKSCKCRDPDICFGIDVLNEKGYCISCDPEGHYKIRRNIKELILKTWLIRAGYKEKVDFTHDKTTEDIKTCAGKSLRPDFIFDKHHSVVIIGCDENQHTDRLCELLRVIKIYRAFDGIPVVYIRYNPDPFKFKGEKRHPTLKDRRDLLLGVLRKCLNEMPPDGLHLLYLYYDEFNEDNIELEKVNLEEIMKTGKV